MYNTNALISATDLPTLVQEYVKVRRVGNSYVGLCPFHKERTPSFRVHPLFFKCFGCGEKGNAITFLMRIEGLGFREACKELADRAGITATEAPSREAVHNAELCAFWWRRRKYALVYVQQASWKYDARTPEDDWGPMVWGYGLDRRCQELMDWIEEMSPKEALEIWQKDRKPDDPKPVTLPVAVGFQEFTAAVRIVSEQAMLLGQNVGEELMRRLYT